MVVLNIISTSKNSAISLHNLHSKLLFVLWDKRGRELVLKGDGICFMSMQIFGPVKSIYCYLL